MKQTGSLVRCFLSPCFWLQMLVLYVAARDLSEANEEPVTEDRLVQSIVIEKVMAFPELGKSDVVVLRNLGKSHFDIRGWYLIDNSKTSEPFRFGENLLCDQYEIIPPGGRMEIRPYDKSNPCGFKFNLSIRDSILLFDHQGVLRDSVHWESSASGVALRRMKDGSYIELPESENIVDTLNILGNHKIFLKALEVAGIYDMLKAASNPLYVAPITMKSASPLLVPSFPQTFGWVVPRDLSSYPSNNPVLERPDGIPKQGPFTVLAPDDAAMRVAIQKLGHGNLFTVRDFLSLPELQSILLYHILPGVWITDSFKTEEPIYSSRSTEVVPFIDGSIYISDTCVDKPTPDMFSCQEQRGFGKCMSDFMVDEVAANWPGGFCQRTCGRCSCRPQDGATCAQVLQSDIVASNGIIHAVNRLLFPPPLFDKPGTTFEG